MGEDRITRAAQAWAEERESGTHTSAMRALDTFQRVVHEEMNARVAAAVRDAVAEERARLGQWASNAEDEAEQASDDERLRLPYDGGGHFDAGRAAAYRAVQGCLAGLDATPAPNDPKKLDGSPVTPPREPDEAGDREAAYAAIQRYAWVHPMAGRTMDDVVDSVLAFARARAAQEACENDPPREPDEAGVLDADDIPHALWDAARHWGITDHEYEHDCATSEQLRAAHDKFLRVLRAYGDARARAAQGVPPREPDEVGVVERLREFLADWPDNRMHNETPVDDDHTTRLTVGDLRAIAGMLDARAAQGVPEFIGAALREHSENLRLFARQPGVGVTSARAMCERADALDAWLATAAAAAPPRGA